MFIELKNIQKTYSSKSGVTFRALSNVTVGFDSTGLTFLVGQSGSGKSTLLNVIGGLDEYDSGELIIAGRNAKNLKTGEVDSLRNTLMGFVFQEFNLIDTLSVFDNVRLALDMQSAHDNEAVHKALQEMGIDDKAHNKTKDMSGGQRQRVAIARALVKDPKIILADEPTGALDSTTSEEVMTILKDLSKTRLVIVVTHDMDAAQKYGDRIIEMKDGRIYRDVRKRLPGEQIETSDSVMYSETLLCVPQGKTVTEQDVKKINEVISSSARKTYVNVETDKRKVKAMFPYLREAVDAGTTSEEEETELDESKFVPYTPKDEKVEPVEFKKSRLPFGRTVRLALNNLNHKKFRLVLTIIIAFIAFTLFGVAQSFAQYNVTRAISSTVQNEHIGTLVLTSSMGSSNGGYGFMSDSNSSARISENDIKAFSEKTPFAKNYLGYTLALSCVKTDENGYTETAYDFDSVVEVDDVSLLGFTMYAGKSACSNYDSVIISRTAATEIRRNGGATVPSDSDLVGAVIRLGSRGYFVAGIFDCDTTVEMYDSEQDPSVTRLYVKPGFMSDYSSRLTSLDGKYSISITESSDSTDNGYYYGDDSRTTSVMLSSQLESYENVIPVTTGRISSESDIIVTQRLLEDLNLIDYSGEYKSDEERVAAAITALNESAERRLVLRSDSIAVFVSNDFTVTGYLNRNDGSSSSMIIISDELKDDIFSAQAYPSVLNAVYEPTAANSKAVVSAAFDTGFNIENSFVATYAMALGVITTLRYVFLGLAIVLCLLVVLLLNSFISSSIKITRKQIGILRALGAKKPDTFKIYAVEGFLMTMFALVAAALVLAFVAPLINSLLSGTFGFYFALITIGWQVYLTIAAVAVVVTVVSVALPLRKFNKISPVSAISGKDE